MKLTANFNIFIFIFFLANSLQHVHAEEVISSPAESSLPIFEITIVRTVQKDNLITGRILVNGEDIGPTFENAKLAIAPRDKPYDGEIKYVSKKGFVLGNDGHMLDEGDFYLMISGVQGRDRLFFHTGNKAEHSDGCILLGLPTRRDTSGNRFLEEGHTLRVLRKKFYGDVENPLSSPAVKIKIHIIGTPIKQSLVPSHIPLGASFYNFQDPESLLLDNENWNNYGKAKSFKEDADNSKALNDATNLASMWASTEQGIVGNLKQWAIDKDGKSTQALAFMLGLVDEADYLENIEKAVDPSEIATFAINKLASRRYQVSKKDIENVVNTLTSADTATFHDLNMTKLSSNLRVVGAIGSIIGLDDNDDFTKTLEFGHIILEVATNVQSVVQASSASMAAGPYAALASTVFSGFQALSNNRNNNNLAALMQAGFKTLSQRMDRHFEKVNWKLENISAQIDSHHKIVMAEFSSLKKDQQDIKESLFNLSDQLTRNESKLLNLSELTKRGFDEVWINEFNDWAIRCGVYLAPKKEMKKNNFKECVEKFHFYVSRANISKILTKVDIQGNRNNLSTYLPHIAFETGFSGPLLDIERWISITLKLEKLLKSHPKHIDRDVQDWVVDVVNKGDEYLELLEYLTSSGKMEILENDYNHSRNILIQKQKGALYKNASELYDETYKSVLDFALQSNTEMLLWEIQWIKDYILSVPKNDYIKAYSLALGQLDLGYNWTEIAHWIVPPLVPIQKCPGSDDDGVFVLNRNQALTIFPIELLIGDIFNVPFISGNAKFGELCIDAEQIDIKDTHAANSWTVMRYFSEISFRYMNWEQAINGSPINEKIIFEKKVNWKADRCIGNWVSEMFNGTDLRAGLVKPSLNFLKNEFTQRQKKGVWRVADLPYIKCDGRIEWIKFINESPIITLNNSELSSFRRTIVSFLNYRINKCSECKQLSENVIKLGELMRASASLFAESEEAELSTLAIYSGSINSLSQYSENCDFNTSSADLVSQLVNNYKTKGKLYWMLDIQNRLKYFARLIDTIPRNEALNQNILIDSMSEKYNDCRITVDNDIRPELQLCRDDWVDCESGKLPTWGEAIESAKKGIYGHKFKIIDGINSDHIKFIDKINYPTSYNSFRIGVTKFAHLDNDSSVTNIPNGYSCNNIATRCASNSCLPGPPILDEGVMYCTENNPILKCAWPIAGGAPNGYKVGFEDSEYQCSNGNWILLD